MINPEKVIFGQPVREWKRKLNLMFFGSGTKEGRRFDLWLLGAIVWSVIVIMMASMPGLNKTFLLILNILEWVFTLLFTIEYILRIWVSKKKLKYILSTYGIVDLVSILPAYIGIFYVSFQSLLVLRSLRLLRIFKIFRLRAFIEEAYFIRDALSNSYRKILMFMMFVSLLVIIIGSIMYIVEVDTPGFESIPDSIYWAVVTITTVGYGDVSPLTPLGKFLSIVVMICGYSIIAVPTGIVTAAMSKKQRDNATVASTGIKCGKCGFTTHLSNAHFCSNCGERLPGTR